MASQEYEDIEFFRSQLQLLIAQTHDSLVEVDLEVAESDPPRHGGTSFQCVLLRCLITSLGK